MFKEYEKFNLTEDEYWECRQNMHTPSYHLAELEECSVLYEEQEECSVLYFDSDDGVALISANSEIFDADGFKIELIDCKYCDIKLTDMIEIIHLFEEFEEIDDE